MFKQTSFKLLIILSILSVAPLFGCSTPSQSTKKEEAATTSEKIVEVRQPINIKLLAFNDLHGHLKGPTGSIFVNGKKVKVGGAQYLSEKIQEIKKTDPDALVVGGGDMIGASPLVSSIFHDEPTIETLNLMGMSVTSVGNHEFDEGVPELQRMKNGGCHPKDGCKGGHEFKGATFDYLAANVIHNSDKQPIFPATVIRTVKGIPVGFVGLTLKNTPAIIAPSNSKNYTFLSEAETINKYVKDFKNQGVETIIVLIHQGGEQDSKDINACENFHGPIIDIVKKLDPAVDAVVSAHTHRAYNCMINNILVTSAKLYGQALTEIDLTVDPESKDVIYKKAVNNPIIVDANTKSDPKVDELIEAYQKLIAPLVNRYVGKISGDLTRKQDASGESVFGRIIADAQLESMKDAGAQIAMMNPGGIREDILYKPNPDETKKPGEVTYGEVFSAQPFGNNLITVSLTGEQIHKLLETQFEVNRILSVSAGFSYKYDPKAPAGKHVDPKSIKLNKKVLDPTKTYRVVANGFLIDGGDGFTTFTESTNRIVGEMDVDALVKYIEKKSKKHPLSPPKDTRIVKK